MKELENLVYNKLKSSPERIKHIKGVIKVSVELAKIYGVNENDAYIAALFHDFTKYDSVEEQIKYLDEDIIRKYEDYQFVYHAYSAANYLKSIRPNLNEEVFDAIKSHIRGRENMSTLEKILLISDKSEPGRTFKAAKEIYDLALVNLDEALIHTLETMNQHLINKNIKIHNEQIKTYNYYRKEEI